MAFQNRIVGGGHAAPDQLLANPKNWRIHPQYQQDALKGVLSEVGWVQTVVVNQRTGHLVDGHLRVMLAMREGEKEIPVLYVDLTPEEEETILAALDPIAGMAGTDRTKLGELLDGIRARPTSPALKSFFDGLLSRPALPTMPSQGAPAPGGEVAPLGGSGGASSFLDAAVAGGNPTAGDVKADPVWTYDLHFPANEEQRETVLLALTKIRDAHDLGTTTNALVWMCERELDSKE